MLENLEPKSIWNYFERFCAIPHPSGHESQAIQFIVECARELNLLSVTDTIGNVLIKKEATDTGKSETIILQSHLDMVPQKNEGTIHDFRKDPIRPIIMGDWVKAQGTTLGADNGIGVAIILAILENKHISHGPIEALFTVDEERGMTGAFGLADDFLTGHTLINLDTENEHEICIGCAGGTDIIAQLPVQCVPCANEHLAFSITLCGLQGGHSGMEIHLGRGNALKLMCRLLLSLSNEVDCQLVNFNGGSARNAIPREAFSVITVHKRNVAAFKRIIDETKALFINEFRSSDPHLAILVTEKEVPPTAIDSASFQRLLTAISKCPNGVLSMNDALPDTVQTSNNCAIINFTESMVRIDCMLRSSNSEELSSKKKEIAMLFERQGASVTYGSTYPGWQPVPDSKLLDKLITSYIAVHRTPPKTVVVHAGLECGIMKDTFPGMDIISCGPTIEYAHSPDEQLLIASVDRFWKCIINVLAMMS